jgi:hypothetical protein
MLRNQSHGGRVWVEDLVRSGSIGRALARQRSGGSPGGSFMGLMCGGMGGASLVRARAPQSVRRRRTVGLGGGRSRDRTSAARRRRVRGQWQWPWLVGIGCRDDVAVVVVVVMMVVVGGNVLTVPRVVVVVDERGSARLDSSRARAAPSIGRLAGWSASLRTLGGSPQQMYVGTMYVCNYIHRYAWSQEYQPPPTGTLCPYYRSVRGIVGCIRNGKYLGR